MDTEKGITAKEVIKEIHKQGGLAIIPHPEWRTEKRFSLSEENIRELKDSIDAIECGNFALKGDQNEDYTKKLAEELNIPCIYSTDSHDINHLQDRMSYTMKCDVDKVNKENIRNAILEGKCEKSNKKNIPKIDLSQLSIYDAHKPSHTKPRVNECLIIKKNDFVPLGNKCNQDNECVKIAKSNNLYVEGLDYNCVGSNYTKVPNVVRCSTNNDCFESFSYLEENNAFIDIEETVICENTFCKMLQFTEEKEFKNFNNVKQCMFEKDGKLAMTALLCNNVKDCIDGQIDRDLCWSDPLISNKFRCVESKFEVALSDVQCITREDCPITPSVGVKGYDKSLIRCNNNLCEVANPIG